MRYIYLPQSVMGAYKNRHICPFGAPSPISERANASHILVAGCRGRHPLRRAAHPCGGRQVVAPTMSNTCK